MQPTPNLHEIYETLCAVTFWLTPSTVEGIRVLNNVIRDLRGLEEFLNIPEDERLRKDVVQKHASPT